MAAVLDQLPSVADSFRQLYKDSLHEYVKDAWHIVEPATDFSDNEHIAAICEHLQAISEGRLQHLIINVPPRFMKSLLVSVMWPTWEWGAFGRPSSRWIFATYQQKLSTRDSVKCRRILESNWYLKLFGSVFKLTSDQNEKTRFENDKTGYRIATSVGGGATGEGGDRVVVDDPHNVQDTESEASIESTTQWWDEAMSTRLNDQATGSRIVVMQRIKDKDLTGHLLAEKTGYEHLMIPMEYEARRSKPTHLGALLDQYGRPVLITQGEKRGQIKKPEKIWRDWRTQEGQLAWPERFPAQVVKQLAADLGTYAAAGQLQQDPAPRAGGMFKSEYWRYYDIPSKVMARAMDECIASWDCTFKDSDGTDYVAGHVWGRKGVSYYLLARKFGRMAFSKTRDEVYLTSVEWREFLIGSLIEDKANGPAVIDTLKDRVQGIVPISPQGGKTTRANAMVPAQEAGQIWLPNPHVLGNEWVNDVVQIFSRFPKGDTDDDVDAASQAINWFRTRENEPRRHTPPALGGQRAMR